MAGRPEHAQPSSCTLSPDNRPAESPREGEADLIVPQHRDGPTTPSPSPSKGTKPVSLTWRRCDWPRVLGLTIRRAWRTKIAVGVGRVLSGLSDREHRRVPEERRREQAAIEAENYVRR